MAKKAGQILPRNDLALQLMLATNDQFNINTIGAVLKYEAAKLSYTDISSLSDDQWQKVIKAYNGGGDKGKEYAQKVQQYLNPMREYLYSLNK